MKRGLKEADQESTSPLKRPPTIMLVTDYDYNHLYVGTV